MWKKYFKKHEKRKPREQLVRAVSFCKNKNNALDLGSGTFIESKFLARNGFLKITAVDSAPEAKKYNKNISSEIQFQNLSFQKYNFVKNSFDLINAQFSLPFHGKKNFNSFIKKITSSLRPGGIFVGQFFGNKDSFNNKKYRYKIAFHTRKKVLNMLSKLKTLEFKEEEKDGKTASGVPRHWHIFYFIAQKK